MSEENKLILYFVPSLVATLLNRERAKGSPLTEQEVIDIRDKCPCIALPPSRAELMDESRGYKDIEADDCWNQWQMARKELNTSNGNEA